jgi:hypothetical protein
MQRFLSQIVLDQAPDVPLRLTFKPAEAAQVDFGAGPMITDVYTGEVFKTWFFVMTLAWSRHQYAEFVRDQTVATWLGCHRRAFEWFGGCVSRVITRWSRPSWRKGWTSKRCCRHSTRWPPPTPKAGASAATPTLFCNKGHPPCIRFLN